MKLYLAAVYTSNFSKTSQGYKRMTDVERKDRDGVRHVLESYHYIHRDIYVDRIRRDECKVFLDSGAFSAFTKGTEIDLPEYCDYVKRNFDILEQVDGIPMFSVLDGIGDPQKTYDNQMLMERLGVRPLPCFHFGEDERWLEWYMSKYEYITIGGMVPISTPQLYLWLDRIFHKYLTDGSGRPRIRVHGFGLTSIGLMERYPWYSVDSSSWVQIASNGSIYIPDRATIQAQTRKGILDEGDGVTLSVSRASPNHKEAGRHLDTLTDVERKEIVKFLEGRGYEIERLRHEYLARWSFNCWSFTELNNRTNKKDKVFIPEQPLLF